MFTVHKNVVCILSLYFAYTNGTMFLFPTSHCSYIYCCLKIIKNFYVHFNNFFIHCLKNLPFVAYTLFTFQTIIKESSIISDESMIIKIYN